MSSSRPLRLFVALALPEATRRHLARVQQDLREKLEGWRWVRPEGIHLTLRFLGDVPEDTLETLSASLVSQIPAEGAIAAELGDLDCFPNRRRPRVLFVALQESTGRLEALARAVGAGAQRVGLPAEPKSFRAHLTLARARDRRPEMPTELSLDEHPKCSLDRVELLRSELLPGGARYTVLRSFPLAPA